MDSRNILILIATAVNLFLGVSVYRKGKDKAANISYGLVALSVFFWSCAMVLYRLVGSVEQSIFWCRILYTAPILINCSLLYFVFVFPQKERTVKKPIALFVFLTAAALEYFILFSDLVIKNIVIIPGAEKQIIFGWLYFFYVLFIIAFFVWCYFILFFKIKRLQGIYRTQTVYVFFSTIFASFFAMISNLLLPTLGYFYFNWAGQVITSFFMLTLIGYAIVAHRLMDVKVVLRQSFVYLFSALAVIVPAFLLLYYADIYLSEYIVYIGLTVLVFSIFIFPSIRDYYYRIANRYFFSSLYDSREVIAKLSDGLRSTLEINEIYRFICDTLSNSFHTKANGIVGYDEKKGQYQIRFNGGFNVGRQMLFPGDERLHKLFIEQSKAIVVEELKSTSYKEYKEIIDMLVGAGVAVVVPLNLKGETLGAIVMGPKESGDMVNDEDLKTLEVIASQSAIAIKNAQLYDESKRFAMTLQAEVERQTAALKRANEELKKLDQAKSDFISIASHQLRTPLTAIRGFSSMILEGSYGRLTNVVRDKVEKISQSAERLIRLVNDLLDLSHMEGGKMEYHFAKIDLGAMVKSVTEELEVQAQKKKLKLELKKEAEEFWVWADEQKLRQVVMNLIDNAIKYTPAGAVKVKVEKTDSRVVFSVKDTGVGMKPGEINLLFQKFVRGTEASHYHADGAGIGLYVARQLIEAHQGRVWAESDGEDKGSTFLVELPIYKNK